MTTIATDGITMVSDGFVTGDGLVHSMNYRKVYKLQDGRIVGVTGTAYDTGEFVNWLECGGDKPKLSNNFEALVLVKKHQCMSYNQNCLSFDQDIPAVAGSGSSLALGAMLAGASPSEAVAIAIQRDLYSGGAMFEESM